MASTALVILEGGHEEPVGPSDRFFLELRRAVVLDVIEAACASAAFAAVLLCTDDPGLLAGAAALGAEAFATGADFRFQAEVRRIVRDLGTEAVVLMGGTAVPLARADDFHDWVALLESQNAAYFLNNPMSPDVVGVRPARALLDLPLPACDNALGLALRRTGMRRFLLPQDPRVHFDLDTPTDALILAATNGGGPRTRALLTRDPWPEARERLQRALAVLDKPGAEVFLAGRVSPALISHLNGRTAVRTRVLSEERGMKALGREDRGEVRSLLAGWIEDAGIEAFFRRLERTCSAAFIDTRPLFAHGGRRVTRAERFASDLGEWSEIGDPWVRDFTRRAVEASISVVLGGHCLVHGGLRYALDEGRTWPELVGQESLGWR